MVSSDKLSTGTPLDKLLDGGLEQCVITNVYGPAGSGKTNIALSAVIRCDKKIIYIDTEGSFSLERFRQIGGDEKKLRDILIVEVHDWKEQHDCILSLEGMMEGVGLIVVDSLVSLYRLELDQENFQKINKQLATQYSILSKMARKYKIPVLVTNQVYSLGEETELTSRMIAKYWSKALIELKKLGKPNCRIAFIRKHRSIPEGKKVEFKITEKGMEDIGILENLF